MAVLDGDRKARVELVAAAHRFTLTSVPFHHPESENALSAFVTAAGESRRPAAELDAVLLHTLAALNSHAGNRIPTLTDRYLALGPAAFGALGRFRRCVEDLLKLRGIRNLVVQQSVAIIEERYADPKLSLAVAARDLGRNRTAFAVLFKLHTERTFQEYLGQVRLDRAAGLLSTTDMRIKEVWAAVGYNGAADFDHDFRRRFDMTPREYRTRSMAPIAPAPVCETRPPDPTRPKLPGAHASVLIVEDDDVARDTLQRHLTLEGHTVEMAATGEEGLRATIRARPDVLLLDLHLPGIDGLECLRRVRQHPNLRQPAVALMTADWEVYEHAAELEAMNATIVPKPCFLEDVGTLVTSLCRGGKVTSRESKN